MIMERFGRMRNSWRGVERKFYKHSLTGEVITRCGSLILFTGSVIWLIFTEQGRQLDTATKVLCITVISSLSECLYTFIDSLINTLQLCDFGENYISFLEIAEESKHLSVVRENVRAIKVCDVSFLYPKEEKPALSHIELSIQYGEKIGIVGRNGSGKSTLVKILCGLYTPTEGNIEYIMEDGKVVDSRRKIPLTGTAFQDFTLFPVSVEDNILLGRDRKKERLDKVIVELEMQAICGGSKAKNNSIVGKIYDENGIELSGGEKQKIAIARALYSDGQVIILDEPNSALDPKAEQNMYRYLAKLSGDNTVLFVSHRLSSCRFCDRIIVLKEGKVIEIGKHEELMKQKGEYYSLFTAQAELYKLTEK